MSIRISDNSNITTVSDDDILPITDISDPSIDKKITIGQIATFTESQDSTVTGTKVFADGVEFQKGNISFGQYTPFPTGLGPYTANYVSPTYGARMLAYNGSAYQDLSIGSMPTAGTVSMKSLANGDCNFGYNVNVTGTCSAGGVELANKDLSNLSDTGNQKLNANAGALKISALGTVSSNITLDTNTVTTADVSGAISITLPTTLVSGNENTVVFDFTTTSSSSPTINQDATTINITAASNATPIVITATAHGFNTGDKVYITGVGGNTAANGTWVITRLTANTFSLNGSVGNGAYTSGGTTRKANFKWSDKNSGKAPTSYSIISGVRNILIFKTHDGGSNWEAEYTTYGGVETLFIQPVLTANGTLGGSNFAVYCDSPVSGYDAYNSFDGNTSTAAALSSIGHYLSFYNSNALRVSSLLMTNWDGRSSILGYSIYGSNDNSIWTTLTSGTNNVTTAGATWDIPVNSSNFYKYYKIYVSSGQNPVPTIRQVDISATYIAI